MDHDELRAEIIARKLDLYEQHLNNLDAYELLGEDFLDRLIEETIEQKINELEAELEAASDEELGIGETEA